MGDIADMLIEQMMDEGGEDWEMGVSPRKVLKCRFCKKPNLVWRKILDQWVMFESDTKVHTCGGYEPPIEVMKEITTEVLAKTREKIEWRNFDRAKKRGGLIKLLPVIPDDQLVNLYACFISDREQCEGVSEHSRYENEIEILHKEILRRMTK